MKPNQPDQTLPEPSAFLDQMRATMEKSILHHISQGSWIMPDYQSRIKLPPSLISEVWDMVDQERIKRCLVERIEREFADRIVNHIATEMATDIKQILGVPERREAIRALARQHIESLKAQP